MIGSEVLVKIGTPAVKGVETKLVGRVQSIGERANEIFADDQLFCRKSTGIERNNQADRQIGNHGKI